MSLRARAPLALLVLALALSGCGSVQGPTRRVSCPSGLASPWRCYVVQVPLDHSGKVPGITHLAVAEYHQPGPPRPAVLALAGGPGSAAIPGAVHFKQRLQPLLKNRDLVIVDQRGTGVSDPISCPQIDANSSWTSAQISDCAKLLGPKAAFYGTKDSVADLEDVRLALKIPHMTVFGVSYGTKVASDYARAYPHAVDALVLDSVITEDTDPYYRRSATGASRVLRNECAQGNCVPGRDPVHDLETVVKKIEAGRLPGIKQGPLLHAVVSGGSRLQALPKALAQAAGGNAKPLAAVLPAVVPDARAGWLSPKGSNTLYLVTSCEDGLFPWSKSDTVETRLQDSRAELARLGNRAFAPFSRAVGSEYGAGTMCARWPDSGRTPAPPPLPNVPALLLQGADDDLAPISGALDEGRALPRSKLVVVPRAGHGVLRTTGPAAQALSRFAADIG